MGSCCGPFVPGGALQGENGADGGVAISASGSSVSSGTVVFSNSNSITFGMSGSTVTASFAVPGSAVTAIKSISAGATNATGPGVSFANGSGVSFGVNGNTITASIAATTETPFAISAGTQSVSTGTVSFANSNGITFGMSGSNVITASVSDITYKQWIPWAGQPLTTSNALQSSLFVHPRTFPNLAFSQLNEFFTVTNATNSTGTQSYTQLFGFYTKNGSSLSLLVSTSFNFTIDNSGTVNASLFHGWRLSTVPWTTSISKGDYWIAILQMTDGSSQSNASFVRPFFLNGLVGTFSGMIGSASAGANASIQPALGYGVYSAQTAALPNAIGFAEIRGSIGESYVHAYAFGSTI